MLPSEKTSFNSLLNFEKSKKLYSLQKTSCGLFLVNVMFDAAEAVTQGCSVKKMFLKNSQNSQENTSSLQLH